MSKVYHISISDLRKLKHGALHGAEKSRVLDDLHDFGLDEAFVQQMDEDDFEAIADMIENSSDKVRAVSSSIPKEINWVGVVAIVLGAIVIMMLLLDITRPESVRDLEEGVKTEMKEIVEPEGDNHEPEQQMDDGDERLNEPVPGAQENENELRNEEKTPDNQTTIEEDQPKKEVDTLNGTNKTPEEPTKSSDKPEPNEDPVANKTSNKPDNRTSKPVKTFVEVASAKVIMEEATNRSKYTPADVPKFNGGKAGLERYVKQQVGQIEHKKVDFGYRSVIVTFEVTSRGKVENVELMAGLSPELDKKTLEIVRNMPDWNPGKRVKMKYQMAVKYK